MAGKLYLSSGLFLINRQHRSNLNIFIEAKIISIYLFVYIIYTLLTIEILIHHLYLQFHWKLNSESYHFVMSIAVF